jgi:(E)-2-((N-methylformamido)methylene)succinate hydrolase
VSEQPTLILLHGVGLNQSIWATQVRDLSVSHRVITYDLLGHGEEVLQGKVLDDWVSQLENHVDALGLEKISLLGFSFGGMIAQSYAARHQRKIDKLVLLSTVYDRSEEDRSGVLARLELAKREGPEAIISAALARWFSPAAPQDLRAMYDSLLRGNDAAAFLAAYECFATADKDLKGALANFQRPTLVMTGELDRGSTPAMARKLAGVISNAQCYIVPGGRHMMSVEMPELVNPVLSRFLKGEQS